MDQDKFREFEDILHPLSVAVVGASVERTKMGTIFFDFIHKSTFKGVVYPVNSDGNEVLGVNSYPRVKDIPNPVDYVIVSVPAASVLEVLEDCAAKGVKAVHVFAAGFREGGTAEGRRLEEEMARIAREGGFRIIGPNSLGVSNSANGLSPLGLPLDEAGPVAILSQSGSVTIRSAKRGLARGIRFSKVISYGNGCDLDSTDYLEYFADDPDTGIIGLYMEGTGDGQRLFGFVRQVCKAKPVVVWKGGRTGEGAEVTISHTGSLAIPELVWSAFAKQTGMVEVGNMEEFVDALLAFYCLGNFRGHRLGMLCGLLGGGGGEGVTATDVCSSMGMEIPPFSARTRQRLMSVLPAEGRIFRNPLDFGIPLENLEILKKALDAVAADPVVDLIVFHDPINELCVGPFGGWAQDVNDALINLKKRQPKPMVVVSPPGSPTTQEQWDLESELNAAWIPVFPNIQQAAKAIAGVSRYFNFRDSDENQ